jgi:PAS domain S-box-containing protein
MKKYAEEFYNLNDDLLCVANLDGYFIELNEAWHLALGWTVEELCSKPFFEFVNSEDLKATHAESAKLAQGQNTIRFSNRYKHKNGSWVRLQWNATLSTDKELFIAIARVVS